jgi:hypothetical protein
MDSSNDHYVYLLREREFIKTGENVYKIGRTQKGFERVKSYPNGSELVFYIKCDDCIVLEREVILRFTELFKLRNDIGREYFEGDWKEMVKIINSEWDNQCPSHGVNSNGFFDENDDAKSLIRSCFDAWRNSRFNSICSKDNNSEAWFKRNFQLYRDIHEGADLEHEFKKEDGCWDWGKLKDDDGDWFMRSDTLYKWYMDEVGPISTRAFGDILNKALGLKRSSKKIDRKTVRVWVGIRRLPKEINSEFFDDEETIERTGADSTFIG